MRRAILPALVALVAMPSPATAGWAQPVVPVSPRAEAADLDIRDPSLAEVGGVPYVAWSEYDRAEQNYDVRVARVDAATGAWVQPWAGVGDFDGGINRSSLHDGREPSLASIDGVPWVAWVERDGTNDELRVARLDSVTNRWVQPWTGVSDFYGGINQRSGVGANAGFPSLASIGGVPYVAWAEAADTGSELRVARLEGDAWEQAWPGVTNDYGGINQSTNGFATLPSLASVGGVPYVAWAEYDGTNYEARVARLDAATRGWEQPWAGVSDGSGGINESTVRTAFEPSLTSIGGVPYLAWDEYDGTNTDVRVARLSAGAWSQPWAGVSTTSGGVEGPTTHYADEPSVAAVGGVPFVAWRDSQGTNYEIRAARLGGGAWSQPWTGVVSRPAAGEAGQPSLAPIGGVPFVAWREAGATRNGRPHVGRLEPEFTSESAVPTLTGATLTAEVRTFGIPYPIGFEYGTTFEHQTAPAAGPAGSEPVTVGSRIGGLTPATAVRFRPFAIAGLPAPRVLGRPGAFSTLSPPDTTPRDTTPPAFVGPVRAAPSKFVVGPRRRTAAARRKRVGRGTTFRYRLTEAARVVFTIERRHGRRHRRIGGLRQQAGAGANAKRFSGRIGRRRLSPGRYRAALIATDAVGNTSRATRVAFRVVRGR